MRNSFAFGSNIKEHNIDNALSAGREFGLVSVGSSQGKVHVFRKEKVISLSED